MTPIREAAEIFHFALIGALLWMIKDWLVLIANAVWKFVTGRVRDYRTLMLLGLFVMYAGHGCDNTYWITTWKLDYWEQPLSQQLIDKGIFSNIIFRGTTGIAAIYCHILAEDWFARERGFDQHKARTSLRNASVFGILIAAADWMIKHWWLT